MQRVLNLAARIVTRCRKCDHIAPVLKKLNWLPVKERIDMKIVTLVFKSLSNQAPIYHSNQLAKYNPRRPLRSSNSSSITLVLGTARTRTGRGAWNVVGPSTWNSLPAVLRGDGIQYSAFITKLHNHFYDKWCDDEWCALSAVWMLFPVVRVWETSVVWFIHARYKCINTIQIRPLIHV